MNILLTLLYSVVWLVCTILGRVAPESVARAWCEYHLEGMSILRYTYRSLAKAAEMREGKVPLYRLFSYLEGLAHYLGYRSGDEKLESGFLRLFLWHICAKVMRWVLLWRWRHVCAGTIHGSAAGAMVGLSVSILTEMNISNVISNEFY
ncbi:hypothetical protein ACQFME_002718 [Escherichia coli]|nr:hypothetical protein [Escherichia coli]MCW7249896.1 hypothetical protein [Escherichia coli]